MSSRGELPRVGRRLHASSQGHSPCQLATVALCSRAAQEALVGFPSRGCVEVVSPHGCHPVLLEALIFQWSYENIALLGQRWSRRL